LSVVFFVCTAVYLLILGLAIAALVWQKIPRNKELQGISVIVAARNEERNLPRLIPSLLQLDYQNFEVIIVNDHSTDASLQVLKQYQDGRLQVIDFQHQLPGLTGKKAALQMGINAARFDILAFTDADCVVPSSWLREINASFDSETDYLLGYSILKPHEGSSENRLQNFERGIYYALAGAGLFWRAPVTSSACNMAYRKSLFVRSGGFEGIGHLLSGDDDLLLMKMMPRIRKGLFNPSPALQVLSIIGTDKRRIHQTNIRRASKFKYYPFWLKSFALFAFLYFALFYYSLFSLVANPAWDIRAYSLIIKTSAELCLVLLFFSKTGHPKLSALYPAQILLFPAQFLFYAIRGMMGGYQWK